MPKITITFTGLMLFVYEQADETVDVLFPLVEGHGHGGSHVPHNPLLYVPPNTQHLETTYPAKQLGGAPVQLRDWATTVLLVDGKEASGAVNVDRSNPPATPPSDWSRIKYVPNVRTLFPEGVLKQRKESGPRHTWLMRGGKLTGQPPTDPAAGELWTWLSNTDAKLVQRYVTDVTQFEFEHNATDSVKLFFSQVEANQPTLTLGLRIDRDIDCSVVCHPAMREPRSGMEVRHLRMLAAMAFDGLSDRDVLPFCPPSQCPDDPLCPSGRLGF